MKMIVITGRVTKDAVLNTRKVGESDHKVTNFNVAVNTRTTKKDDQGRWVYKTDYYRISLWDNFATSLVNYLKQGRRVNICGENFGFETWMDRQGVVHPVCHITNPRVELADDRKTEADEPTDASMTQTVDAAVEEELPFD